LLAVEAGVLAVGRPADLLLLDADAAPTRARCARPAA